MNRTGLVSVSFRGNSHEEIINAVKSCGLSYIEWGSDVHAKPDDTETLVKIKKLCDGNGVKISSYGTYFHIGNDKAEDIIPYIKAAGILGTDIIRVWCGTKPYRDYTADELEIFYSECRAVADIAEREGVTLCMECHLGTFTDTYDGAVTLMEKVNSEAFRMYWQPHQNKTAEQNVFYATQIAKYTKIIHVFNWTWSEKYPLENSVDIWRKYLSCFDESAICLLEFMPDGRIESLEAESKSLFKIVK